MALPRRLGLAIVLALLVGRSVARAAATCTECCPVLCGNAVLDPGEGCDDGNLSDGDGCSSACRCEEAPAGSLACGFGMGGVVAPHVARTDTCQFFGRVAVGPDGSVIVAGGRLAGLCDVGAPGALFYLARLDPEGIPDPTFGQGGIVIDDVAFVRSHLGLCAGLVNDVAIDPAGRILVSASVQETNSVDEICNFPLGSLPLAIFRFLPNGLLDETFASGQGAYGPIVDDGETLAVEKDGRIVVAGDSLLFLTKEGDLDAFATQAVPLTAMALQDDGSALVSNGTYTLRYSSTAVLDAGFGDGNPFGGSYVGADAIATATDGDIVLTASAIDGSAVFSGAVVRLLSTGARDPGFGTAGVATPTLGGQPLVSKWTGVVVRPDGKVVLAGSVVDGNGPHIVVARLDRSGALDTTFGTGGVTRTAAPGPHVIDLFPAPGSRIIAAFSTNFADSGPPFIAAYEAGYCGDGVPQAGEACDDGAASGTPGNCCTRTCTPQPDGTSCGDGDVCNGAETCQAGTCTAGAVLTCDDGNACTTDSCHPATGCQHATVANGSPCSDGNACNGADTCQAGTCTAGAALTCNDGNACTTDSCDPATGCQHAAVANGSPCSDGNACNGTETCQAGTCTAGTALDCDDGNACTIDTCNPAAGCQHATASGTVCPGGTCEQGTCVTPTLHVGCFARCGILHGKRRRQCKASCRHACTRSCPARPCVSGCSHGKAGKACRAACRATAITCASTCENGDP